jgi:SAM-dependent methyltransferase
VDAGEYVRDTTGEPPRLHPRLSQHSYLQLRHLANHLREAAARLPEGVVLDIGCGAKPYASLFREPYIGLDLSTRHGSPDAIATAEDLPVRSGSVATVLSTQQLEHVMEPRRVLGEACRVLYDDGVLLLSTHGVWVHHPDPHDYWRWTEEGLVKLIEGEGFQVTYVRRQGELVGAVAGLLLYPLSALSRSRSFFIRALLSGTIVMANLIAATLDRIGARVFPRHLASASYLVVATRR